MLKYAYIPLAEHQMDLVGKLVETVLLVVQMLQTLAVAVAVAVVLQIPVALPCLVEGLHTLVVVPPYQAEAHQTFAVVGDHQIQADHLGQTGS